MANDRHVYRIAYEVALGKQGCFERSYDFVVACTAADAIAMKTAELSREGKEVRLLRVREMPADTEIAQRHLAEWRERMVMSTNDLGGPPGFIWRGYDFPEFSVYQEEEYLAPIRGTSYNEELGCAVTFYSSVLGRQGFHASIRLYGSNIREDNWHETPQEALDALVERVRKMDATKRWLLSQDASAGGRL